MKTLFISLWILGLVLTGSSSVNALTPQEKLGKKIYLQGQGSAEHRVIALFANSSVGVPGEAFPCVNCHDYDGRGKPEGGIFPSNITWEALTKTYDITHESGRTHSSYNEQSLERAITEGIDPSGNKLAAAMPRYQISPVDRAALIAYLKKLSKDRDPGLTDAFINIGALLPTKGRLKELGQAMKTVMTAYFEDINLKGGIYNRQIKLTVAEFTATPTSTTAKLKELIEEKKIFAMAGAFIAGADKEILSFIEDKKIPLVGPFTLFPQVDYPLNRYVFYLFSGLQEQARVMVDFAAKNIQTQKPRVAIIYPESSLISNVVESIEKQSQKSGWSSALKLKYSRGHFDALKNLKKLSKGGDIDLVFFLGSGVETMAVLKAFEMLRQEPDIFLIGPLMGKDIFNAPTKFINKIILSFPSLPFDQTPAGLLEFRKFTKKHRLKRRHLTAQLSAYVAAKMMVEGLKRGGRKISREKLILALEGLYEFETGLTPPISYGPNRRVGALGAYMVKMDPENKRFIPLSGWTTPK